MDIDLVRLNLNQSGMTVLKIIIALIMYGFALNVASPLQQQYGEMSSEQLEALAVSVSVALSESLESLSSSSLAGRRAKNAS